MTPDCEPMVIALDEAVVGDLHARLSQYRRPPGVAGSGWKMGIDLEWLDDLIAYWRQGFDWRAAETKLNRRSHYRIPLTDAWGKAISVHILFEAGSGTHPEPILLTAGWPSSFLEFEAVIDHLAHPERYGGDVADARTVIVADLPGFGLSDPLSAPMSHREMATLWRSMMVDHLGYPRFLVHGGDWGAVVGSWLALDHAEHLSGLHLSMLGFRPFLDKDKPLSDAERIWLGLTKKRLAADCGYREAQATKPNTLAVGLSDSPVAMAAWMIEKYHGWCGGAVDGPPPVDRDMLLTSATLYWATNNLPIANWIYWADRHTNDIGLAEHQRVEVPTGLALFDGGFFPPPPTEWAARAYTVVHRTDYPVGGHFPAWTQPKAFVDSLQRFARVIA